MMTHSVMRAPGPGSWGIVNGNTNKINWFRLYASGWRNGVSRINLVHLQVRANSNSDALFNTEIVNVVICSGKE